MDLPDPRPVGRSDLTARRPRCAGLAAAEVYLCGSLEALEGPAVAIVGTRAPSPAGAVRARILAARLAGAGLGIVSGLALGIDAAAHEGALAAKGRTIGVLGGGHRCFFPRRNLGLALRMVATGGAVLSPFAPDAPAMPHQFLARNAIVAALADAVVVVEAAARSGALNTAGWAADLGVPVLAMPGDVDRPKAAGCNALIRDGATLVRDADDVLEALGCPPVAASAQERVARVDPLERQILRLAEAETTVDGLAERTGAPVGTVAAAIAALELSGDLERTAPGTYARRPA